MRTFTVFILIVLSLSRGNMSAQISLDNIVYPKLDIGRDFYTTQISDSETKYVFLDTATNTFSLYNMDFSPFLVNISVPEPFITGSILMQPIYISRALFDCDTSNIEYAFESTTSTNKPFRIMRTDGTTLFQLDSANGPYCLGGCLGMSDIIVPIKKTSDGTKLFLQKYSSGVQEIRIYSLCGSLTSTLFNLPFSNQSFVKVFPNPSSEQLTFQLDLPDNIRTYHIILFDNVGKELKREIVAPGTEKYAVNVSDLSSGLYFYSLHSESRTYQSGKVVITK